MSGFLRLGLIAFLLFPAKGEETTFSGPFLQVQDGDTVVFVGDSITHQSLYTQYLENFFYTRYPDRDVSFHNAGVAGDTAADVLQRFVEDIATREPDHVTVLLGMNDGQYESFSTETLRTYQEGVQEVIQRIKANGGTPIALSPTMFDHHQRQLRQDDETYRFRNKTFDPEYNSLLAYFSAWLREESSNRQTPFVDLWSPLNAITFAKRQHEPDFTLIEDAIHPGAAGHALLAFTILKDSKQERPFVSCIDVVLGADGESVQTDGEITELVISSGEEVHFQFLAQAIPWRVPEQMSREPLRWGPSAPATLGYQLAGAESLNRETLRVAGMRPGLYELLIDGVSIDSFSHDQLNAGVELQTYLHSPQNEQALEVALLNRDRNDDFVRPMRETWARIKSVRKKEKIQQRLGVINLTEQAESLKDAARELEMEARSLAAPIIRHYRLRRIGMAE